MIEKINGKVRETPCAQWRVKKHIDGNTVFAAFSKIESQCNAILQQNTPR